MTSIQARKYENLQKERFDTLFSDVLSSYALTNETAHQLKATRAMIENLSDQIKDLNKQFELSLIRYGKDYSSELSEINFSYQEALKKEDKAYAEKLKSLKRIHQDYTSETYLALEQLQKGFINTTKQTNIDIRRALIDMKQRHEELDLEYEKAKKTYKKQISELEDTRVSKLTEIEKNYEHALKENKQKDQTRLEDLAIEQESFLEHRQQEQQDFETSIVKIKTIFNRVVIKLNEKIILLQKQYHRKIDAFKIVIQYKIKALNDTIEKLKDEYSLKDDAILERFKADLLRYDKQIDVSKTNFHNKSEEITKNYARDITVNNSRLANFKETNQQQIIEVDLKATDARKHVDMTEPDAKLQLQAINQTNLRNRRLLQTQLQNKIKETRKQNKLRHKSYQSDLLKNEFEFTNSQETLKLRIKLLQAQKDHELKLNKLNFDQTYDIYMSDIRVLERQLFLFNQTTQKEDQGPAIYPYESEALLLLPDHKHKDRKQKINHADRIYFYESEVLLARQIYDTEMSFRTLENNFFKQKQSLLEKKRVILAEVEEQSLKYQKTNISLAHENETKLNNLICYLNMEYEKNNLQGYAKIIAEKKKEFELYYQKQELHFLHQQDVQKEKKSHQQKILNFKQRLSLQNLEINENKALIDHDATIELAKSNYTREVGIGKAKRIIDTAMNETQRQRRLFDIYFQMILAVVQEFENFSMLFRDIFLTSKPQEIDEAVSLLQEAFIEQQNFKNTIIEALLLQATAYYEEKINELTAFKYMNLQEEIIEDYENEHKLYVKEVESLDQQLKITRRKIADYYQQIAILQNANDDVKATKQIIYKQMQTLSLNQQSKQERKTFHNLRKELKTFQKEIIKNNTEIKHIKMMIQQANKEIKVINSNYKPLQNSLVNIEKNKTLREETLKKNQYQEGKVYYDAIDAIKSLTIKVKDCFDAVYTYVLSTTKQSKFDQVNEQQFKTFYNQVSNKAIQLREHLQAHHKTGIKLCDQQFYEIKREQQRIIDEYETSYRLTSSNIRITTEKRQVKMHKKAIELDKYQKSFMRMQSKQFTNQLKIIQMHFKDRLNQLDELLTGAHHDIDKAYAHKKEILEATKANIDMVVTDQNLLFKQKTQASLADYNHAIKLLNERLLYIDTDLESATHVFENKLEMYSDKDKKDRKRIALKLYDNRYNYQKMFSINRQKVEKLREKSKHQVKQLSVEKHKKQRQLTRHYQFLHIPYKIKTNMAIRKKKRQIKKTWRHKQQQFNQ